MAENGAAEDRQKKRKTKTKKLRNAVGTGKSWVNKDAVLEMVRWEKHWITGEWVPTREYLEHLDKAATYDPCNADDIETLPIPQLKDALRLANRAGSRWPLGGRKALLVERLRWINYATGRHADSSLSMKQRRSAYELEKERPFNELELNGLPPGNYTYVSDSDSAGERD